MRIALLQFNPKVGAPLDNSRQMIDLMEQCPSVDLFIAPELCLMGYPPRDLLSLHSVYQSELTALETLKAYCKSTKRSLILGHLEKRSGYQGRPFYNSCSLIEEGSARWTYRKRRLPNYDIFDEARFFEPSTTSPTQALPFKSIKLGVSICEDNWSSVLAFGKRDVRNYSEESNLPSCYREADLLINLSASPYHTSKRDRRMVLISSYAARSNKALLYTNCWGANDDIIFDGSSFAVNADGKILATAPSFQDSTLIFEFDAKSNSLNSISPSDQSHKTSTSLSDESYWDDLRQALVVGIKDYVHKSGFKRALLGLSGGIDSALVAALAVQALGKENVNAIYLPSPYSSDLSKKEALALAQNLGISFEVYPIENALKLLTCELKLDSSSLAHENIQSRLRGLMLMTFSNIRNTLLIATGNKSELAMGYSTLYGDMCGALMPIGDLYKSQVYGLAHYINHLAMKKQLAPPIPNDTLYRAPSAELVPNQKDEDTLPPYAVLDVILHELLENQGEWSPSKEAWQRFLGPKHSLDDLLRKVHLNEFKRYQAAPILKVSQRAFGSGWRMPLAKGIPL